MTIFFALVTYLSGDTIEIICIQIYILVNEIQWIMELVVDANNKYYFLVLRNVLKKKF